jgi:hypothetical protein
MLFGLGYRRDPGVHGLNGFYAPFQQHRAALLRVAALPLATHNRDVAPPVWDQATTSSCTGHGTAGMVTTTLAARGRALPSPVCPRTTYTLGRAVDRHDPSVKLTDEGAAPNSVVRAISQWGIVLSSETDGGRLASAPDYSAHLAAHVNDEPKLGEIETGARRLVSGFVAIADDVPDKDVQFKKSLASGHCVGVAVAAGTAAFQGYDEARGPMGPTGPDPDHWIFCVDYSTAGELRAAGEYPSTWPGVPDDEVFFLFQNSWGVKQWTATGRFWATLTFVQQTCKNSVVAVLGV